MLRFLLACIALIIGLTNAQTGTIVDANGNTIVQVITLDPNGLPTTQTLQTLPGGALTTSTSTPTSTPTTAVLTTPTPTTPAAPAAPPGQQGPVGQPAPTVALPGGVTPYTYTTVINGVTTAVSDNFTPTAPATVQPTMGPSGTILDYSEWLSMYGPKSTAQSENVSSGVALVGSGGLTWWSLKASITIMLLGGAWVFF